MARKALVTGACGFIGSHLIDELVEQGWEVRATDLPSAGPGRLPQGVEWIPGDLTDRHTLVPVVDGVDVLFHVAAIFDFAAPWEILYRVNVLGTENLLEAARRAGVGRVLSWSSYGVYGKFDRARMPIDEEHPVRPKDPYGRSKAMQDAVVWRYHDGGLAATILRPSAPYGPRARYGMADLFRRLDGLPVVPVPRNHRQRVMSVHVKDVARAAVFLAGREETVGEEYNITDDGRYPTHAFIALFAGALGKKTVPVYVPVALLKASAWMAGYGSLALARLTGGRPILEKDTVYYLTFDFLPSNDKIKSLGFTFLHPDPATGIPEAIAGLRREGFLKNRDRRGRSM